MEKIRLTLRDRQIISILQNQDFCFYKDIKDRFFPSDSSACNRLSKLKERGHILIESLSFNDLNKSFDSSSMELIGRNLKIIRLSDQCSQAKRRISPWKKTHQVLLFSVKERLENLLNEKAVFENKIRDLKETQYNGNYEPLPDFYLKGEGYKLAVELELTLKSQGRYFLKMSEYGKSRFTHVLYVATHIKKMQSLIKTFHYRRYIGIVHYSNLNEVISHRYGELSLSEWLVKRTK